MTRETVRLGYTVGLVSVAVNIAVFSFKYWVGARVGSIAMIADAWHTMSDILTSLVVIVGFWIASKPADEKHPFGHGRAESISAIIIGTVLAIVGFTFLQNSFLRLLHNESVSYSQLSIFVFFVTIFVKEGLAQYSIHIGKKIQSQSLVADGWHHRSDAITNVIIVIGALVGSYFWWIDGIMGLLISLFILKAAYSVLKSVADSLLGEELDKSIEQKLQDIIKRISPEASNVHHVHIHRYGDHVEMTLHIMLPSTMSLKEAHAIAKSFEDVIAKELNMEATVHVDTIENT